MNYLKTKLLCIANTPLKNTPWSGNAYIEAEYNGYPYSDQYTYSFLKIPTGANSIKINSNAYLNSWTIYATNGYTKTGGNINPSTILGTVPTGYNYEIAFNIPIGYKYIRILNRNQATTFEFL